MPVVLIFIILLFSTHSHADESATTTDEKPHQKSCTLEFSNCAQLKSIDLESLKLAKENKNPSRRNKEELLILTRCLFKEEVPVSEVCKAGLEKTLSNMPWFQRRIFKNIVL